MKKIYLLFFVFGLAVLSTGCAISTDRYQPTADNQNRIKDFDVDFSVAEFTANKSERRTLCRLANNVEMPDGITFEQYIENAFIEELKLAQKYDPQSEWVIKGNLNDVSVSSGMTDAHWTLDLTVSNQKGESFTVVESREYDASFMGGIACQNDMPKSFMPTVQALVDKVVSDPRFEAMYQ
ncbi:MAG: hypothetical protein RI567_00920 [Marinobacter sp.]|nr:hypothetical protein [Marinobacter sp.]